MNFTIGQQHSLTCFIEKYGEDAQELMAIEEMSELIQALMKFKREETKKNRDHIIEEISDVLITVEQLAIMYGVEDVASEIDRKISRQILRMQHA